MYIWYIYDIYDIYIYIYIYIESSHYGQPSMWNQKTVAQKWIPCISENTHNYLTNSIWNISVATDEGPSSKLALREGGSRGNIES